jgi:hypothetical protein
MKRGSWRRRKTATRRTVDAHRNPPVRAQGEAKKEEVARIRGWVPEVKTVP